MGFANANSLALNAFSLRTEDALQLVAQMVGHAAFQTQGRDFYLEESEIVDELLCKKMITSTNDNWGFFCLTPIGKRCFKPAIKLRDKHCLLQHVRDFDGDHSNMSVFELCAILGSDGWQDEEMASGAGLEPYQRKTKEKIWYRHPSKPTSKNYLRVLVQARKLFSLGLAAIHHFQSESCLDTLGSLYFVVFDYSDSDTVVPLRLNLSSFSLLVYVTCSLVSVSVSQVTLKTEQPRYYSTILTLAESNPQKLHLIQPGCRKNVLNKLVGIENENEDEAMQVENMQGLSEESGHLRRPMFSFFHELS